MQILNEVSLTPYGAPQEILLAQASNDLGYSNFDNFSALDYDFTNVQFGVATLPELDFSSTLLGTAGVAVGTGLVRTNLFQRVINIFKGGFTFAGGKLVVLVGAIYSILPQESVARGTIEEQIEIYSNRIQNLPPDRALDLYSRLSPFDRQAVIKSIPAEKARELGLTDLSGTDLEAGRNLPDTSNTAHDAYRDSDVGNPNANPGINLSNVLRGRFENFPNDGGDVSKVVTNVFSIELSELPPVPLIPSSDTPISMDRALDDLAEQFLIPGIDARIVESATGYQIIQSTTNAAGKAIRRRIGFDVDPTSGHLGRRGSHLNLQTQVDGDIIDTGSLADPHISIDPSTVRPGDYRPPTP